jgi:adenylate kinase
VVATHFVGKMVQPSWVKLAIVLRLDPTVLYRRLRRKGRTKRSAWENAESELVDVCLIEAVSSLGKRKVFEIDTSSKPQSQIVSEALKIVAGKRRNAKPSVNWLNHYDPISLWRNLGRRNSTS